MKRFIILIVICLGFVATSKAQTPPVCTFAQVAFNSVNNTFEYHCPNTNNWFPATVNGSGGGSTTGGLQDPGANGIVLRIALNTTTTAAASDVVALFGGSCSVSSFLRGDGTCAPVAGFTFPTAGVAVSAGTSGPWNASLAFGTGPNALLQLDSSGRLPAVSAINLTNFPTLNQNTTGNAATANALAATPSLCTTGQAPTGILTNGNATGCAAIGGSSGLSGMTATQIPVAATANTITSSIATTGSGNVVLSTSPVLTTPNLGIPSAINLTNSTNPAAWNLPSGTSGATQSIGDNTSKLATDAFVIANSNGAGSGASPVMGFYLSPACPVANTGQCFFSPANTQIANDCNWSSSGTLVTCASSHFNSGDVGKRINGYLMTGQPNNIFGCVAGRSAFSSMGTSLFTISNFVSGTQINMSANPANTATTNHGCIVWGTPDDTNAAAVETAYSTVSFCPKLTLAAAIYWFDNPHFYTQPTGCAALPSLTGASATTGNMVYTSGFELEGRGAGTTTMYLSSVFPNGDPCTRTEGPTPVSGCFLVPVEGKFANFQITGGGQSTCQVPNTKPILGMAIATLENVALTNLCFATGTNNVGIFADQLSQLYQVNNSGFGSTCLQTGSLGLVQAHKLGCENSPGTTTVGASVDIPASSNPAYAFQCIGCILAGSIASASNNADVWLHSGANIRLIDTYITNCEEPAAFCSNTGGTYMIRNDGGRVYMNNTAEAGIVGTAAVVGMYCSNSAGVAYLQQSWLSPVGGGNSYLDVAGCTLFDLGGNTGVHTNATYNGTIAADGHSAMFTCTGTANASVTNSLFGSGPNVTATTCSGQTSTLGAGLPFNAARFITGFSCSSSATTVSVACTLVINGTPNATATCTMTASKACSATGIAVGVNQGDLLSVKIVTGAAETGANIKSEAFWN